MAKSARALAHASSNSKSDKRKAVDRKKPTPKHKARGAALHALDEFHNLRDSLLAFGCVQSFLSPHHRQEVEELHVERDELRALVTCINAETQRRIQAMGKAIDSVRQALH
jgi:hypothetical protein